MPTFQIRVKPLAALGVAALVTACAVAFSRASVAQEAAPPIATLFVVGDSTARNNAKGAQGWGDPFVSFFDASKIAGFAPIAPDALYTTERGFGFEPGSTVSAQTGGGVARPRFVPDG